MVNSRANIIPVSAIALLCACAPTVHLREVEPIRSEQWSGNAIDAETIDRGIAELLGSSELDALVVRALDNNREIAIAATRVDRSRATLSAARKALLPEISASAGATRTRQLASGSALDFRDSFARLDVDMDIDLFGKTSSRIRAALSRTRAAELQADAVLLAVEADVAEAWVQRATIARRIEILERTIERAQELERVVRARYEAGAATRVDLGLQSIQLMDLRNERSRLLQALDQTRTALALLTGEEAPIFTNRPADLEAIRIPAMAPSTPASAVLARPDVRASEALVEAAKGDVGLARASFFPQITISAAGLLGGILGSPLSKSVSAGSSLFASIFDRGTLQANLRIAEADQVEAVETYRLAVLSALRDIEDIRGAIAGAGERAVLLDRVVEEARLTARLANVRYIEGEEDLKTVIDAEQWLGDAEAAQALGVQERIFAQIALYRAVGGRSSPVA